MLLENDTSVKRRASSQFLAEARCPLEKKIAHSKSLVTLCSASCSGSIFPCRRRRRLVFSRLAALRAICRCRLCNRRLALRQSRVSLKCVCGTARTRGPLPFFHFFLSLVFVGRVRVGCMTLLERGVVRVRRADRYAAYANRTYARAPALAFISESPMYNAARRDSDLGTAIRYIYHRADERTSVSRNYTDGSSDSPVIRDPSFFC